MSTTIDQKIVEIKFDNRDFERNAKTSMSTLEKLKEKLNFKSAEKGLEELQNASDKLDFSTTYNGISRVIPQFNAFYSIANRIFERLTDKAINLVKSMSIDQVSAGMAKYEEQVASVQTIMAATGKDIESVTEQVERLSWFSDETSYSFSDMISNVGKFTSAGVDLEQAVTAMEGIANWAAISGQNATTASRAMYNLAQSLGSGYVALKDWMSIENANMATKEFKENALEAAVAAKKLVKVADGKYILKSEEKAYKKATKKQKQNWNTITYQNFRESLQKKWFDTTTLNKVLTMYGAFGEAVKSVQESMEMDTASGTIKLIENTFAKNNYGKTAKDIKEIAEALSISEEEAKALAETYNSVGRSAFKAAQEAKTWTDVVGSVKDAVSSQFMNMFTTIFGDYQDAKVLFTDMANELWDVFAGPLDAFNEELSDAFYHKSAWKDFTSQIEDLGITAEKYQEKLLKQNEDWRVEIGDETYTLQELIDKFGSLEKVTERGYITTDQLFNAFKAFNKDSELTSEQLDKINENIESIFEKGGRIKLIEAFGNLYKYLKGIAGIISKSFKNIFGELESSKIASLIDKFYEFASSLDILDPLDEANTTVRKLSAGFDGLFSIFRAFAKIISTVITPIKELAKIAIPILKELFLDIFENAGKTIQSVSDKVGQIFDELKNKIVDFFSNVTESDAYKNVQKFVEKIKKAFSDLTKTIEGYLGNIDLKKTADNILYFIGGILGFVNAILTSPTVTTFIGKVADSIKKLWDSIKSIRLPTWNEFWESIQNIFKKFPTTNFNFESLKQFFKFVKDTFVTKFNLKKNSFFNSIAAMYEDKNSVLRKSLDFLSNLFEGVGKFVKSAAKVSFDELVSAGKKIGELAVLFASFKALMSLSGLFDSLADKISGRETFAQKVAAIVDFLKVMAVITAEVAAIVYIFGKMDNTQLQHGLLGLIAMMGILIGSTYLLNKVSKDNSILKNTSSAWTLVALALAIKAVGDVLMKMQDYKFNAGAIIGIFAVMGGLIFAMSKLSGLGSVASAASILSFVTALNLMLDVIEKYAKFNWKENSTGVIALAVMMGVFVVIIRKLNAASGLASKIQIVGLIIALKFLVDIVIDLGSIKNSVLSRGLVALTTIGFIMAGLYSLFSWISKKFGANVFKGIDAKLGSFIGVASLLLACAAVIIILGNMPTNALIQGGLAVTAIMGMITVVMIAMKNLAGVNMGPVIAMLIGMTTVLVAIGYLFGVLLDKKNTFAERTAAAAIIVGVVGVLSLLMGAMAKFVPMLAVIPLGMYAKAAAAVAAFTLIFAAVAGLVALIATSLRNKIPELEMGVTVAKLIGQIVGSLVGGLIGGAIEATTDSFPAIAKNLSEFMENLQPFLKEFKGDSPLSSGTVSEFVNAISNLGSNLKKMTGNLIYLDRLSTLAEKLSLFIQTLVNNNFFSLLSGVTETEVKAVSALGDIIEAFSSLPADSGLTEWWTGKVDYSIFDKGGSFDKYINALIRFISGVKQVDVTDKDKQRIQDLLDVSSDTSQLIEAMPKIGGIKQAWEGFTDFTAFDEGGIFDNYVTGLKRIFSSLALFTLDNNAKARIQDFVTTTNLLTSITSGMESTQKNFWETITTKDDKLTQYATALSNFTIKMKSIFDYITGFKGSYDYPYIRGTFLQMMSLSGIFEEIKSSEVTSKFIDLMEKLVTNYSLLLKRQFESIGSEIKGYGKDAATNLYDGFRLVLIDPRNISKIRDAASEMASAFVKSFNLTMQIKSPSRVMAKAADYTIAGFVNEMNGSLNLVSTAGRSIGTATLDGLRGALSDSNRLLDTNRGELSPVISPVVDLTNVKRGGQQIASMLTDSPMYDLVSNRGMNLSSSINIQNGNTGVVGAINDLQYKFDALLDGIRGMNVVMDSGALVGSISSDMDKALGTISTYKGRGNA